MKTIRHLLQLGALAACVCIAPAVQAQDDEQTTARVKFSDPSKPGTFKCSVPWAEVRIVGTDDAEVVVISSLNQKGEQQVDREGFRRLDNELSFELTERENVVTLHISGDNPWTAHGTEFEVRVPKNTNLSLRTEAGGDIEVAHVQGDIEVRSTNGEVELTDITSASVETMNGGITASFAQAPTKPVSLTSMNGEIDLRLPADTKANLRMRTHNGSIRTNFPEDVLQARTETAARSPGESAASIAEMAREARAAGREAAQDAREMAQVAREEALQRERHARSVQAAARSNRSAAPAAPAAPPTPRAVITPRPHRAPHFGGKSVAGELNGGGIDITLTSMNGTITLRQLK